MKVFIDVLICIVTKFVCAGRHLILVVFMCVYLRLLVHDDSCSCYLCLFVFRSVWVDLIYSVFNCLGLTGFDSNCSLVLNWACFE